MDEACVWKSRPSIPFWKEIETMTTCCYRVRNAGDDRLKLLLCRRKKLRYKARAEGHFLPFIQAEVIDESCHNEAVTISTRQKLASQFQRLPSKNSTVIRPPGGNPGTRLLFHARRQGNNREGLICLSMPNSEISISPVLAVLLTTKITTMVASLPAGHRIPRSGHSGSPAHLRKPPRCGTRRH